MTLAFITGITNILIDFIFWILLCPVENPIQVTEELLPQKTRRLSKNISYVSLIRKNFDFSYMLNYFDMEYLKDKFYKNEQHIVLSNRLLNWHDLIVPSLRKIEIDAYSQEKLSYVNQMGIQSIIDTRSILFNRSISYPELGSPSNSGVTSGISVHHFIHQLKLQLAQLTGEKRKLFEESWR